MTQKGVNTRCKHKTLTQLLVARLSVSLDDIERQRNHICAQSYANRYSMHMHAQTHTDAYT